MFFLYGWVSVTAIFCVFNWFYYLFVNIGTNLNMWKVPLPYSPAHTIKLAIAGDLI
jgi:hypothetical protein